MTPVAQRPARTSDGEFLFALMEAALGPHWVATLGPWEETAQRERSFATLKLARHEIIEVAGEAVGCIALERNPEQWKLNRIFLLPSHQGRGIGTQRMEALLAEADTLGVPIRLRVLHVNPARRLYDRLGFAAIGATATHFLMERLPARASNAAASL